MFCPDFSTNMEKKTSEARLCAEKIERENSEKKDSIFSVRI